MDNFKREEDRNWRITIDHQVVTLLTGHQVLDRRLTEIESAIKDIDLIMRGDLLNDSDGLQAQIHQIQTALARLNAVVFMDSTGKRGLQHEVEALLTGEHRMEYQWKFLTSVVVAVISLIGLLVTNWDRMTAYMRKAEPAKVIPTATRKPRTIHYTINENAD